MLEQICSGSSIGRICNCKLPVNLYVFPNHVTGLVPLTCKIYWQPRLCFTAPGSPQVFCDISVCKLHVTWL